MQKMIRRRIISRSIVGVILVYLLSYVGISIRGHYEPSAYGLIQGPGDTAILAPKSVFGYAWNPFESDRMDPDADHEWELQLSRVYRPLIFIDQKLWHKKKEVDQVGNGDYRVKYFFDWETKTYRDINLD